MTDKTKQIPCPYCGYAPRSFLGSLKNSIQGHNCPALDVTKLAQKK